MQVSCYSQINHLNFKFPLWISNLVPNSKSMKSVESLPNMERGVWQNRVHERKSEYRQNGVDGGYYNQKTKWRRCRIIQLENKMALMADIKTRKQKGVDAGYYNQKTNWRRCRILNNQIYGLELFKTISAYCSKVNCRLHRQGKIINREFCQKKCVKQIFLLMNNNLLIN